MLTLHPPQLDALALDEAAHEQPWEPSDAALLAELEADPRMPPPGEGSYPVAQVPAVRASAGRAAALGRVPARSASASAPRKTDVVARGALYREEWARHRNPGEDKRTDVRWRVREQLRHDEVSQEGRGRGGAL